MCRKTNDENNLHLTRKNFLGLYLFLRFIKLSCYILSITFLWHISQKFYKKVAIYYSVIKRPLPPFNMGFSFKKLSVMMDRGKLFLGIRWLIKNLSLTEQYVHLGWKQYRTWHVRTYYYISWYDYNNFQ